MPSLLLVCSLLLSTIASTAPPTKSTPPTATSKELTSKTNKPENQDTIDYESDIPPTTNFDKRINPNGVNEDPQQDLITGVARMFFALIIVLGVIFICSKYGLSRLTALKTGGSGKHLEVVERIQLGPKHSLFVVDVKDNGRILLGAGDGSVSLLTQLAPNNHSNKVSPFSYALEKTPKEPVDSTSSRKVNQS